MPTTKTGNRDRQDWLAVLFSKYDLVPKKKKGEKKRKKEVISTPFSIKESSSKEEIEEMYF